jgi:Cupin
MSDELASALEQLRLQGALFFRSELTEPFAFESSPLALADALVAGAERLILFHIVASGSCWVAVDDGVRYRAEAAT